MGKFISSSINTSLFTASFFTQKQTSYLLYTQRKMAPKLFVIGADPTKASDKSTGEGVYEDQPGYGGMGRGGMGRGGMGRGGLGRGGLGRGELGRGRGGYYGVGSAPNQP